MSDVMGLMLLTLGIRLILLVFHSAMQLATVFKRFCMMNLHCMSTLGVAGVQWSSERRCRFFQLWLHALQELLKSNMQQNLQLVVQVAKEYTEQLGAGKIIELLENNKTYHGLYYYLGSYIAFSEDPEVHFK